MHQAPQLLKLKPPSLLPLRACRPLLSCSAAPLSFALPEGLELHCILINTVVLLGPTPIHASAKTYCRNFRCFVCAMHVVFDCMAHAHVIRYNE